MRATERDAPGFERLYDAHAPAAMRAAHAVLGDRTAASDVVHEVFLTLWRRPELYDPRRGPLSPYVTLMARSRALDALRRDGTARRALERLEEQIGGAAAAEDAATCAERRAAACEVRTALAELPAEQRQALVLAYWGGLTASEIAERSGTPLGTVKSRLRLGLARLRDQPRSASLGLYARP